MLLGSGLVWNGRLRDVGGYPLTNFKLCRNDRLVTVVMPKSKRKRIRKKWLKISENYLAGIGNRQDIVKRKSVNVKVVPDDHVYIVGYSNHIPGTRTSFGQPSDLMIAGPEFIHTARQITNQINIEGLVGRSVNKGVE